MSSVYVSKEFSHRASDLELLSLSLQYALSKIRLAKVAFSNLINECKGKLNKAHVSVMEAFLSDDVEKTQKYLDSLADSIHSLSRTLERMDLYQGILHEATTSLQNSTDALSEIKERAE